MKYLSVNNVDLWKNLLINKYNNNKYYIQKIDFQLVSTFYNTSTHCNININLLHLKVIINQRFFTYKIYFLYVHKKCIMGIKYKL